MQLNCFGSELHIKRKKLSSNTIWKILFFIQLIVEQKPYIKSRNEENQRGIRYSIILFDYMLNGVYWLHI